MQNNLPYRVREGENADMLNIGEFVTADDKWHIASARYGASNAAVAAWPYGFASDGIARQHGITES